MTTTNKRRTIPQEDQDRSQAQMWVNLYGGEFSMGEIRRAHGHLYHYDPPKTWDRDGGPVVRKRITQGILRGSTDHRTHYVRILMEAMNEHRRRTDPDDEIQDRIFVYVESEVFSMVSWMSEAMDRFSITW